MKAIQLERAGQALVEREVPLPPPAIGEVRVEVRAAGICRSDAHYRRGRPQPRALPRTLGHEIAGVVSAVGAGVTGIPEGLRVAVNYVLHCGACRACLRGAENLCPDGGMIGNARDGGYADFVVVPARNLLPVPDPVSFAEAAIMMCSTATAYHALRLADLLPGESVGLLGFGGLGVSALHLARVRGAGRVIAVDPVAEKRKAALALGALALDPHEGLTLALREAAGGDGVNVVLDFAGHGATTLASLRALARGGRLVVVAVAGEPLTVDPYRDLIGPEVSLLGCNDHLTAELRELLDLTGGGVLDLSGAITRTVPFSAAAINQVLDELEGGTAHLRTVATREG